MYALSDQGVKLYGEYCYMAGRHNQPMVTHIEWITLLITKKEAPVIKYHGDIIYNGIVIAKEVK